MPLNHLCICGSLTVDLQLFICHFSECGRLTELNIFGCVTDEGYGLLTLRLPGVTVNGNRSILIARPTTGIRRSSIWLQPTRDEWAP